VKRPTGVDVRSRLLALVVACATLVVTVAPAPSRAAEGDEVTLSGTLRAVVADDFTNHRSRTSYHLETAQGSVALVVAGGGPPAVAGGDRATVTGTRLADGRVRVERMTQQVGGAEAPLSDLGAPTASALWPGPAVRRVAIVLGTYTDVPRATTTPDLATVAAMGDGASVRTLLETASRGRVTVDATIHGP